MTFIKNKDVRKALGILLGFCLLALLSTVMTSKTDTAAEGYLPKGDYGSGSYSEELDVTYEGDTQTILVEVPQKRYEQEEADRFLDEAEQGLEALVLGDMSASYVDKDVDFLKEYPGLPVSIAWMTHDPNVLDFDGRIQLTQINAEAKTKEMTEEGAKAETGDGITYGTDVAIEASLSCQGQKRSVYFLWTIYPKRVTGFEAVEEAAMAASKEAMEQDGEVMTLPETVNGSQVIWREKNESPALSLVVLGFVAALLFLYAGKRKAITEEKHFQEALGLDYPHIVEKLVLFLCGGLSMRKAFDKMAEDYRIEKQKTHRSRAGFEAVSRLSYDMANGIPEAEAYRRLGNRCGHVRYRTFSVLLVQNLRRGSRELIALLERDAAAAFDERKKQARILGEEASAKLLFPMILMLLIVFVILMVPAFVSMM